MLQTNPIRQLTPEMLDSLPAGSAEARDSRSDLRFINTCMGNHRWIIRQLRLHLQPGERILELGAGDGELLGKILQHPHFKENPLIGLDLVPVAEAYRWNVEWVERNLKSNVKLPETEVLIANLILHHLTMDELRQLGKNIPGCCRIIIACEPYRAGIHQLQAASLRWLGASEVTLHDARVSIEAGFQSGELGDSLELSPEQWDVKWARTWLGAYRMLAVRR